jgi:hypothetical protein
MRPDRWETQVVNRPAYRTLDGVELDLPVMDRWIIVPRALVEREPDLTWVLDYDDGPPISPQVRDEVGGDPELDFSEGSLLVPIERWNSRAAIEPGLVAIHVVDAAGAGSQDSGSASNLAPARLRPRIGAPTADRLGHAARVLASSVNAVTATVRWIVTTLALLLALSFAAAVVEWVVPLRDGMSVTEVGTGAVLLVSATLLCALARRFCDPHGPLPGEGAIAIGRAAHTIVAAGAMVIAGVFAAFVMGFGT